MYSDVLFIYDKNYKLVGQVDTYKSLIWTTRFYTYGDFELQIALPSTHRKFLKLNYYVKRPVDDYAMIIETLETKTNLNGENILTVKGRALLSICDRRVIWEQECYTDETSSQIIVDIVKSNFLPNIDNTYYKGAQRRVSGLEVLNYATDTKKEPKTTTELGTNVLEKIQEIAKDKELGIKIDLRPKSHYPLCFSVYSGKETHCVFSEHIENIKSTTYKTDSTQYKNVCVVGGADDVDAARQYTQDGWRNGNRADLSTCPTGLDRRECFLDKSSMSVKSFKNLPLIGALPYETYLFNCGVAELDKHRKTKTLDGESFDEAHYQFRKNYDIGDTVKIFDEYDNLETVRVSEVIESWNDNGYTCVPTFEKIE